MDWIEDFVKRFENDPKFPQIQTLKKDGFNGNLTINFNNGVSKNCHCNVYMYPKP